MKRQVLWINCIAAALFCGPASYAETVITLDQVGTNVVATASGTVNLTGLTFFNNAGSNIASMTPSSAALTVGSTLGSSIYTGFSSSPTAFGIGSATASSSRTGNYLGPLGNFLRLPGGYMSDAPLSGTATWNNTTIAALGATPGTYTWTWGSGVNADSLTLDVAPEPKTTWLLLGISFAMILGTACWRPKSARVPDKTGIA